MRRILAIDGGGLRGAVPASFLAEIEDRIGDRVSNYFDLIAGTSTGGLIALGLGLGFSARQVLSFYEDWGPRIFKRRRRRIRLLPRGLTSPLYDLDRLRIAVEEVFGEKKLGESRCRLLISRFDLHTGKARLWRTYSETCPENRPGDDVDVVEVALSTSAAPVYFRPHRSSAGTLMVDGGVWANCPVLVAVTEAISAFGWNSDELLVLSLGCAIRPFRADGNGILRAGMLKWAAILPEMFLSAQEDSALRMAGLICGSGNLVRVNPTDPTGGIAVDNPMDLPRFRKMGARAALEEFPHLKDRFFRERAEPFITSVRRVD